MKSLRLVVFFSLLCIYSSSAISQSGSSYSGSWYNPARDGEGFHIQILPNGKALVIWFTYPGNSDDAEAEQAWILGIGTFASGKISITNAFKARGPVFGSEYDKADYEEQAWGQITVTFSGSGSALVEYDGLDGAGSTQISRLTNLIGSQTQSSLPPGISGAWFDPQTDGQGWFVEILNARSALVYWFTYDQNGNQAWNLGIGNIFGKNIILPDNLAGTGTKFGSAFMAADIELKSFSMLTLNFTDCAAGSMSYLTADGQHTGSFSLTRLTYLDGYDCDSIGQPALGQSVMTNSADPLLSSYLGLDLTLVNVFGKKSKEGGVERVTSGFLQTPAGEAINFEVNEQGLLSQIFDNTSGITLTPEVDENGDTLIVLNDPANGVSASTGNPSPSATQKTVSTRSAARTKGSRTEATPAEESQSVVQEVELCGQAVDDALVNFRVTDASGAGENMVIPATLTGPGTYATELPTSLGSHVDDVLVANNCSTTAAQFSTVCNFITGGNGSSGLASGDCLQLGHQIGVIDPEAGVAAAAVCAKANAAFSSACAANELRGSACGPSPVKIYRDFSSVQISAETRVPGLGITSVSETLTYDTPGEVLVFPKLVLPGQPYYKGHSVMPVIPTAGETYTLNLKLGCVNEGLSLAVENTTNGTSSSCNTDAQGNCTAQVESNEGEMLNSLEITGPGGFRQQVVQHLMVPDYGMVEFWFQEYIHHENPSDQGFLMREAVAIQRYVKAYYCLFSSDYSNAHPGWTHIATHFTWDQEAGFYLISPEDGGGVGTDIIDDVVCGAFQPDFDLICNGPHLTKVSTWAEATEGDGGVCEAFP